MKPTYLLDWNEIAFKNKSELGKGTKIFIAAPRSISQTRIKQLFKTYLPANDLVFGIAKESYVDGLSNQPQFSMLGMQDISPVVDKVHRSKTPHQCQILEYNQRDLVHILQKVSFKKVIFLNGSWYGPFHMKPAYYTLMNAKTPYELVSPFSDETEARTYAENLIFSKALPSQDKNVSELEIIELVAETARKSYDYAAYQTGAILARKESNGYSVLFSAHNKILPYETYAMHNGSLREKNFTIQNDMNHYDTLHAEMALLAQALKVQVSVKGCTLFVNLLPCPQCARMIAETEISEIVYSIDHSGGFAAQLLEDSGKTVRRIVQKQ